MNAIITGIGGFLGRALAQCLLQTGANVVGLDIHATPANVPEGIRYHQVDIRNFDQLQSTLRRLHLESAIAFHFAGQSHVGQSRLDPLATFSANVMGTAHVLEACRQVAVERVIYPSTALIYAKPMPLPVKETDAVQASSVYGATKLACEALLRGYATDFGFACRIARLGNVYGPGATTDSVAQIILRQVKQGGPVSIRTLTPVRDFVYRDDVMSGLMALANHSDEPGCQVFNLSSGRPTSIREFAEAACRVGDIEPEIIETEPQLAGNDDRLVLSIERMKEIVGWQPSWSVADGIRQTLSEMEVAVGW